MHCLCRPSRIMSVRINLLDETEFVHEIKDDLPGQALLDVVFARLNLIETSYFGMRFIDEDNQTHWLDPASRISRQLKPKTDPYDLYFGVKFYAADPCKLVEEITRYQLFLQVKQDVLQGRLSVPFELAAELGAFVVQSELGDYDQRRHSKGYVSEFRLLPNQSNEFEIRVAELHQQLTGMSPALAESNYLDKVKWHDMYGVDLHPVLGEDSVEYYLGLTPSGIVVLRNKTTVAHYYWPRVAKVFYKGRYFMLRISDKNNELSTYGFETPRKSACKHLWRCCVEHHSFFRLLRVPPLMPAVSHSNVADIFQIGSRLKCSKEKFTKDELYINRSPPTFIRVPSKRQPRRIIDDFLNSSNTAQHYAISTLLSKNLSNFESPYRSTYSIPTSLGLNPYHHSTQSQSQSQSQLQLQLQHSEPHSQSNYNNNSGIQTPDSPRSTRSAPWPRSQQRSLFGNKPSSPRSVRSASTTGGSVGHHHHRHRNNENHQHNNNSSNKSNNHNNNNNNNLRHHSHSHNQNNQHNNCNSQRVYQQSAQRDHVSSSTSHQRRYRSSSVESHSSNDSRSTRRYKHRHRRVSDNESELSRGSGRSVRSHHRKHRRSRHRRNSGGSDRSYSGHRHSVGRSASTAGSASELIDSSIQWREAQRRQAEASLGQSSVHQASVAKSTLLARNLRSNDSHSDTHSHHKSRRHRKSPSDSRNRLWNSEIAKHLQFDLVDTTGMTEDQLREIPYTVVETNTKRSSSNMRIHKSNSKNSVGGKSTGSGNTLTNGSGSTNGHTKNRVDRIRGSCTKNGSIRSASTVSSRECETNTNNGLVRMMSSISMGDFISPIGSNLSPMENSALRVSHEHTDSGLGAEQDYAYSSERSSDSTRYGTNKSSGASSGSHRIINCGIMHSTGNGHSSTHNNLMQQTVNNHKQQHYLTQYQQQRQNNSFYGQRHNDGVITKSNCCNYTSTTAITSIAETTNHQHQYQQHQQQQQQLPNYRNNDLTVNSGDYKRSPANNIMDKSELPLSDIDSIIASNNQRLMNYTTFENNQYKFSLNNAFGSIKHERDLHLHNNNNGNNGNNGGNNTDNRVINYCNISSNGSKGSMNIDNNIDSSLINNGDGNSHNFNTNRTQLDHFIEWPNRPAAPYYYQGPSSIVWQAKKRDAKSDLGVSANRRYKGQHQLITKTQLLSNIHLKQMALGEKPVDMTSYPMRESSNRFLQPAKSDLFLACPNIPNNDYEPPFMYDYKVPQVPAFLRSSQQNKQQRQQKHLQQQQQQQQQQQLELYNGHHQQQTAYHISGIQTSDIASSHNSTDNNDVGNSSLYGGSSPAKDVMYYQFDNGKVIQPPIIQQPTRSMQNQIMAITTTTTPTPMPSLSLTQTPISITTTITTTTTTYTTTSTNVMSTLASSLLKTSSAYSITSPNIGPLIFLPMSVNNGNVNLLHGSQRAATTTIAAARASIMATAATKTTMITPTKTTKTTNIIDQQPTSNTNVNDSIRNNRNLNYQHNNHSNNNNNNSLISLRSMKCDDSELKEIVEESCNAEYDPNDVFYDEYDNQDKNEIHHNDSNGYGKSIHYNSKQNNNNSNNINNNDSDNSDNMKSTCTLNAVPIMQIQMDENALKAMLTVQNPITETNNKIIERATVADTNKATTKSIILNSTLVTKNLDNYNGNVIQQQQQEVNQQPLEQNDRNVIKTNANANRIVVSNKGTIITSQPQQTATSAIAFTFSKHHHNDCIIK